jgi:hypothetical protein
MYIPFGVNVYTIFNERISETRKCKIRDMQIVYNKWIILFRVAHICALAAMLTKTTNERETGDKKYY